MFIRKSSFPKVTQAKPLERGGESLSISGTSAVSSGDTNAGTTVGSLPRTGSGRRGVQIKTSTILLLAVSSLVVGLGLSALSKKIEHYQQQTVAKKSYQSDLEMLRRIERELRRLDRTASELDRELNPPIFPVKDVSLVPPIPEPSFAWHGTAAGLREQYNDLRTRILMAEPGTGSSADEKKVTYSNQNGEKESQVSLSLNRQGYLERVVVVKDKTGKEMERHILRFSRHQTEPLRFEVFIARLRPNREAETVRIEVDAGHVKYLDPNEVRTC